jgi:hypothetical protein
MILICHRLFKSCHQVVVLRGGLGQWHCRLYNRLQLAYDFCPWICVGRDHPVLHLLRYLLLLSLSLHFLSDALNLCL